ncbi:TPA: hypothetical protein L3692_004119 [Pseudomonas aeruginosa]|nr:hypothetical protein [Pseudomonas aeruginosa]
MTNELNDVRCPCGAEFKADSYDAGFIAGSGMCQNCDAAMPPKDIPAPVEQAGGDERAVDGKPRATKCPDCGEGDLMPGDLCACGYETDPAAGYACSECDGSGDGYVGEVCRECDGSGWFVTPEQARAALAQPSGEVVVTKNESGAIVSVTRQDKEGRVLSVIAESATLTAQAEQAEAERPEVVGYRSKESGMVYEQDYGLKNPEALTTVAECDRIVGELRAENAKLIEALDESDGDRWRLRSERDAALARVAELEMLLRKLSANGLMQFSTVDEEMAVQAALGGAPVAQAQHSVPEGWMLVECGIWTQEQVDEMQKTVARFRNSEFVDDRALAMAVADAGQCKAPEISLAELLAAAPAQGGE